MKSEKWMMPCDENLYTESIQQTEDLVDSDRFVRFLNSISADRPSPFITLCVPFANMDPLAVLELCAPSEGTRFYWERPDQELAIAGGNRVVAVKSSGINRFHSVLSQCSKIMERCYFYSEPGHSLAGPHMVGGFSFFDQPLSGAWSTLGNASFFLPEWLLIRDGQFTILNITRAFEPGESVLEIQRWYTDWIHAFTRQLRMKMDNSRILHPVVESLSEKRYEEIELDRLRWFSNVNEAKRLIHREKFRKIVLARDLAIETAQPVSATKLLHYLRCEYPTCYSFIYQLNGEAVFLGSTPEKLLSLQSRYIKTEALAGSTSRGKTATQDAILEKRLRESEKDREEHAYVLDSIKEKLEPLVQSMEHPGEPVVKKIANVQHLCTPLAASLEDDVHALDILSRLHPTPAVGGYPEDEAMMNIQELEQFERGWYAGPIGWFNAHQRAEFSVGIRSALIRRKKVQFFAGCGIVESSDPETEWEETRLKFLPMQRGLAYALESHG